MRRRACQHAISVSVAYHRLVGAPELTSSIPPFSSLNPSPLLLLYHFFSVAIYSIYLLFTEARLPRGKTEGKPVAPSVLEYPALAVRSAMVVSHPSSRAGMGCMLML